MSSSSYEIIDSLYIIKNSTFTTELMEQYYNNQQYSFDSLRTVISSISKKGIEELIYYTDLGLVELRLIIDFKKNCVLSLFIKDIADSRFNFGREINVLINTDVLNTLIGEFKTNETKFVATYVEELDIDKE